YAGKIGTGLLYLFAFGLLGFGQLYDLFVIPRMIDEANARLLRANDPRLIGNPVSFARLPRTTEEFQVALVQAAEKKGGKLTAAEAVVETGRGFPEVKRQLDRM